MSIKWFNNFAQISYDFLWIREFPANKVHGFARNWQSTWINICISKVWFQFWQIIPPLSYHHYLIFIPAFRAKDKDGQWLSIQCLVWGGILFKYTLFFIRINIFQPSLKLILNFPIFQPRNILRWFLKAEMTWDLLSHQMQVWKTIPIGTYLKM